MNKTTIEWTDFTWNPVTGCQKISQGCKNCYAETMAKRFWKGRKFTDVKTHPERLDEVQKNLRKWHGKRVFVCSMSDLFHDAVPDDFIRNVFYEMYMAPSTTFQLLTKRPQRAVDIVGKICEQNLYGVPLRNVWIGTSCEDQATANERIPLLLQIRANVRFISCEPLLGPIDISTWFYPKELVGLDVSNYEETEHSKLQQSIHWVIAGGESGHGARPMHPQWVRNLRIQCANANIPFLFKQWGEYIPLDQVENVPNRGVTKSFCRTGGYYTVLKLGKSKSGNLLDGKQHLEFPKS